MDKNYKTLDEVLNNINEKTSTIKVDKTKSKSKTQKKKTPKKLIALILAATIALSTGIVGVVHIFKRKNKNMPKTPNQSIATMDLGDMGVELDFGKENENKNKEIYGDTTGNVDVNKIVEKNDKIYVDKESADKSDSVGNIVVDTKDDTLEVKPDGTVVDKTPGYEVVDQETSEVVESGDAAIPEDKVWDDVLGGYVPKEEAGKWVFADATYYNEIGEVLVLENEIITREQLEYLKQNFSTQPSTLEEDKVKIR